MEYFACFDPSASSISNANRAMHARFLLFPAAHRVGRRRFRVGLLTNVDTCAGGKMEQGYFCRHQSLVAGSRVSLAHGRKGAKQAGFWRRDKTQCRYHQDLFLFRRFCATIRVFNHTLHGVKDPSN